MADTKRGTVVCIAEIHWHFTWQVHHEVAAGLAARGYEVYFLSTWPRRWWPGWEKTLKYLNSRIRNRVYFEDAYSQPVPAGVTLIAPGGLPDHGPLERWFNRRVVVPRFVGSLRTKRLNEPLTVINYVPLSYALAIQRALRPDVAIYYATADWGNALHTPRIPVYEREAMQMSDITVANAPYLYQQLKQLNDAGPLVFRPEGKNYELFEPVRRATPPPHPRPVCAYFGHVGVNIDADLLVRVSQRYPLRIIGAVWKPLVGLAADAELVPPVPHEQLPHLLTDVDVLLLPYDADAPHMQGVFPAKTFECLATGKPIVMIGLQYFEDFADVMTICHSAGDFLDGIERAVAEDTPALRELRLQRARENTDSAMIDYFDHTIQEIVARKQAVSQ